MQNMFKNKGVKITEKPFVMEPKVVNPSVHIMDVNHGWLLPRERLLKIKFSKTKIQSRRNLPLVGKKNKNYNNLLSKQYKRCK